jgi:hypothetical protein
VGTLQALRRLPSTTIASRGPGILKARRRYQNSQYVSTTYVMNNTTHQANSIGIVRQQERRSIFMAVLSNTSSYSDGKDLFENPRREFIKSDNILRLEGTGSEQKDAHQQSD